MVEVHKVDYEKDMAHAADNHMPFGDQNVNLADPIGVDPQILEVVGRPAVQNHLLMA